MQYANVWMIQSGDNLGFALQALFEHGIIGHFFGQDLERDNAVQPIVTAAVNLSHSAGTQRIKNLIRPKLCSWREGHILA